MNRKANKNKQINKIKLLMISIIFILLTIATYLFSLSEISISGFITKEVQEINMEVTPSGYSPNTFTLKKGVPVNWNIDVKQLTGCNQQLILEEYGLDITLKEGINNLEFTPVKNGVIKWSCGMNMLQGSFLVTETGEATQQQILDATPRKSSGCNCGARA